MDFDPHKPFYFRHIDPKTGLPPGQEPIPVLLYIVVILALMVFGAAVGRVIHTLVS